MSLLSISSLSTILSEVNYQNEEEFEEEETVIEKESKHGEPIHNARKETTQKIYEALLEVVASKKKCLCSTQYKLLFKNQNYYVGYLLNDQPHGEGEMTWNNGDYYKGDFLHNRIHGKGVLKYSNGVLYEGQFKCNNWDGEGTLTTPSWEYKGEFKDGYLHGEGTLVMHKKFQVVEIGKNNVNTFVGHFDKNLMAIGYRTYKNGVYYGSFNEFGYRKKGHFLFDNNDYYEGFWFNDQFNDFGIYKWDQNKQMICKGIYLKRVEQYLGYWVEGARHGVGRIEFKDRVICCEWFQNKRHGASLIIAANGSLFVERNMFNYDNYINCVAIRRAKVTRPLVDLIMALTTNKPIKLCKTRNNMFRSHIISLEQHVLLKQLKVYPYPIFMINYYIAWNQIPLISKIVKQYPHLKQNKIVHIELHSFNQIIKENCGTLLNIYKTYTTFEAHCSRTDLIMTRLGLWKFYEDVFQNIPSINKADLIRQCETDFDIWIDNPNNPWDKVYFWEFINHVACIISKLNENPFIFYAAIKERVSFLGVFSQMFLVFLREFSNVKRLRPSYFLQALARGPKIVKDFFEKIYLESHLSIRSAFRYFQLNKSHFKNLTYIDFVEICIKMYPHLKDPQNELYINTEESITPLELFEIAFKVAEENILKVLMVQYKDELEKLEAAAKIEFLAAEEPIIKSEKVKKKKGK